MSDREDAEYEMTISLKFHKGGEEVEELGFAGMFADSLEALAYRASTLIDNRDWETEDGMRDPDSVPNLAAEYQSGDAAEDALAWADDYDAWTH